MWRETGTKDQHDAAIGDRRSAGAGGRRDSMMAASRWSLARPLVSSRTTGRPLLTQTAWSLEFSPRLVRPIQRKAPF